MVRSIRMVAALALIVALVPAGRARAQGVAGQGIVLVDVANLRDGAGTQHNIIGQIKKGEGVFILSQTGSWYQVKSMDGSLTGYVQFRLVRPLPSKETKSAAVDREIPRYQFSPGIPPDEQYFLQKYSESISDELRKKIRDLSKGVEGAITFDGADFADLGYAYWDTDEFKMFEMIVPLYEDSFLSPSTVTRVGSGYVFDDKTSALLKNMLQLVQEAYLAAETHLSSDDNNVFLSRKYAALTQVTYVNRRGKQIGFLRPFDVSMTFFSQNFQVFLDDYEDAVNQNPEGDAIQFTTEVGSKVIELLKAPYPRGAKLR